MTGCELWTHYLKMHALILIIYYYIPSANNNNFRFVRERPNCVQIMLFEKRRASSMIMNSMQSMRHDRLPLGFQAPYIVHPMKCIALHTINEFLGEIMIQRRRRLSSENSIRMWNFLHCSFLHDGLRIGNENNLIWHSYSKRKNCRLIETAFYRLAAYATVYGFRCKPITEPLTMKTKFSNFLHELRIVPRNRFEWNSPMVTKILISFSSDQFTICVRNCRAGKIVPILMDNWVAPVENFTICCKL